MISKKAIAASIIALGTLVAVPANAAGVSVQFGFGGPGSYGGGYGSQWGGNGPQWGDHGWRHAKLSTQEVRRLLRHQGYRNIRFVDRGGSTYGLTASRHGRDYFVLVSARSGQVVQRYRI